MTTSPAPHPWRAHWSAPTFAGKNIVIAGRDEYNKPAAIQLIELEGGVLATEVKRDTALVVALGKSPGGATNAKATKLNKAGANIEVLSLIEVQRKLTPTRDEAIAMLRAGRPGVERWRRLLEAASHELNPIDLSHVDLRGLDVAEAPLDGATLDHADLSGLQLNHLGVRSFVGTRFDGAALPHAWVRGFKRCSLVGVDAPALRLDGPLGALGTCDADFSRASLPHAGFHNVDGPHARFAEANLRDAGFANASFPQVDFSQADLSRTVVVGGVFDGASFREARLLHADFINVSLRGADFRGADLRGANFYQSNLTGALFAGSDVEGINLTGAVYPEDLLEEAQGAALAAAAPPPGAMLLALERHLTQTKGWCRADAVFIAAGRRYRAIVAVGDDGRTTTAAAVSLQPLDDDDQARAPFDQARKIVLNAPTITEAFALLARFLGPTGNLLGDAQAEAKSPQIAVALRLALQELFVAEGAPLLPAVRSLDVRQTLLAELQASPTGVAQWNARPSVDLVSAQHFHGSNLTHATLDGMQTPAGATVDFSDSHFDHASLVGVRLPALAARDGDFRSATLRASRLGGDFSRASFTAAVLEDVDFSGARLRRATFMGATLTRCRFNAAQLDGADLSQAACSDCTWTGARYTRRTKLPPDFTAFDELQWDDASRHPTLIAEERERVQSALLNEQRFAGDLVARRQERREAFVNRLTESVPASRLAAALKLLKTAPLHLYADVQADQLAGVVASPTDPALVFACRLNSAGEYVCCSQQLNACNGQQGAPCKHLLALALGLERGGLIAPETLGLWFYCTHGAPESFVDRDEAAAFFSRYQLASAGESDWRPIETEPANFYAV